MIRTVREALRSAKERLRKTHFEAPAREAHLLLAHVLRRSEVELLAHDEEAVEDADLLAFEALIARRVEGEPVAYLLGHREFYGRDFRVDARVLVPRPETEHLIETVLALDLPPEPRILDLGTGSGCIAVTLALEVPGARVLAADRSFDALVLARANARHLTGSQLPSFCGDWLGAVDPATLDLVVTNPPYIAPSEAQTLSSEITDFEPHEALFSAGDGLGHYRDLFASLSGLRPGVPVACEVGRGQSREVIGLAAASGFARARAIDDYAGISRVVVVNRA